MARPITKYTPEFIQNTVPKVLESVMEGYPIARALKLNEMDKSVFYKALAENPLFSEMYNRAQFVKAELLVDEAIDIADNSDDAMKARNQIDIRKWYASKIIPQKFGEKIDINITQNVDVKGAIEEAKKRVRVVTPSLPTDPSQNILVENPPKLDNEKQ